MRSWATALLLAASLGCSSRGGSGASGAADGGETDVEPNPIPMGTSARPTAVPAPNACRTHVPGPRALRRLTATQYGNSLRDLFRDPAVPMASVFDDPIVLGFSSDADALVVKDLTTQQVMSHAETVAKWAVATHLSDLSSCTSVDASCRGAFIRAFGKRAFRAPLADAEVERYDALFAEEGSFSDGVEAVIAAMLQSPSFLYRREIGTADPNQAGAYALTPHEIAGALSYFLVGSIPDDDLSLAADEGRLATREDIDAQALRLLRDPRSRDAVILFMTGWLGLDRVTSTVKDDNVFVLGDSLRQAMKTETSLLVTDTFFVQNGTFGDLLTAPYSFLNRDLAVHYGIDAPVGTDFAKVAYGAGQRDRGILAHASLLTGFATAATSSPVQRGKLVRTRLLCQALPPPPADADTNQAPLASTETTRQHYEQHATNATCASCHNLMDPIGYGFEHYDAFGRRREEEHGHPIDATGTLNDVAEGNVPFSGLGELASYLSTSEDVKTCMLRYWAYYAYGRATWAEDGCTYDAVREEAAKNGFTLQSVAMALLHAPHFTRRSETP